MNCAEAREAFEERLDGPLEPFDRHLSECAGCRRRWEAFETAYGEFRSALALEVPEGLVERLRLPPAEPAWRRLLLAATVAAWLGLGGALVWMLGQSGGASLSPDVAREWEARPDPPRLREVVSR